MRAGARRRSRRPLDRTSGAGMDIGIIGSGHIGGTLTRRLTALGHHVTVTNSRGPASLAALAAETGAKAGTIEEAARARDLVIVTIPQRAVPSLPRDLFAGTPARTAVVDTGNYYPELRDGRIAEIDAGLNDSEWVARHLGRPVLKAFNNVQARTLARGGLPAGAPGRVALSVAGDDPATKAVVLQLIDQLGFDPIDAGTLADSWRQQVGTPAYCRDLDAAALRAALAAPERDKVADYRREGEEMAQRMIAAAGSIDAIAAP
ncbi:NADPH-dependent F420 reductase [Nannocystis radixulma]|uniref:NAD(P)-binding domain-containing protein n=1 Tax=Nannocystis radixulma TaxID=2995305 RepID=A0ABT5B0R2_9BACT|nr:NAD(P)-binding domain-containing protein [Nannocystis radixulma]MDC0666666.1 NAD(P)-binding domain-containing protein [Nannocystis radixulma]